MKAALIREFGDPGCLSYETVPDPAPDYGEVVVRVAACGVNNVDLQIRRGARVQLPLPHICGGEVAGTIVAIAPDVFTREVGVAFQKIIQVRGLREKICGAPRLRNFRNQHVAPHE